MSRHAYGPHHDSDVPPTVTVLPRGPWPRPEERPLPAELARQRYQLNELARRQQEDDAS